MVALLIKGTQVVAPHLVKMGENDGKFVPVSATAVDRRSSNGGSLHRRLRIIDQQNHIRFLEPFRHLRGYAHRFPRGMAQTFAVHQHQAAVIVPQPGRLRLELTAHPDTVNQWRQ